MTHEPAITMDEPVYGDNIELRLEGEINDIPFSYTEHNTYAALSMEYGTNPTFVEDPDVYQSVTDGIPEYCEDGAVKTVLSVPAEGGPLKKVNQQDSKNPCTGR